MKDSKSPAVDGISPKILKETFKCNLHFSKCNPPSINDILAYYVLERVNITSMCIIS